MRGSDEIRLDQRQAAHAEIGVRKAKQCCEGVANLSDQDSASKDPKAAERVVVIVEQSSSSYFDLKKSKQLPM